MMYDVCMMYYDVLIEGTVYRHTENLKIGQIQTFDCDDIYSCGCTTAGFLQASYIGDQ